MGAVQDEAAIVLLQNRSAVQRELSFFPVPRCKKLSASCALARVCEAIIAGRDPERRTQRRFIQKPRSGLSIERRSPE